MKNFSVLTFLLFFVFPSITAQIRQIHNFNDLMESLDSGDRVRIVIHYAQCRLFINNEEQPSSPDAVSGMDIGTFEYFAPGVVHNKMAFVVFSQSSLIQNPKGKGYVINYGKVRINSDGSVIINARYLYPKNYKVLMDEFFEGLINDSGNEGGVYLYKYQGSGRREDGRLSSSRRWCLERGFWKTQDVRLCGRNSV